jgi:hypothetical protein
METMDLNPITRMGLDAIVCAIVRRGRQFLRRNTPTRSSTEVRKGNRQGRSGSARRKRGEGPSKRDADGQLYLFE